MFTRHLLSEKFLDPSTGFTVTANGTPLTAGRDYDVTYENNVDAGTATVVITGKGNYEGSKGEETFTIKKADGILDLSEYSGESLSSGSEMKILAA